MITGDTQGSKAEAIHKSLLAGLVVQVGMKTEKLDYMGARGLKFHVFPGSVLFKSKPGWLMSAELVETTRLYARTCGPIRPEWVEQVAPHLLSKSYGDPFWNAGACRAVAHERVSMMGLTVVPKRTTAFVRVDAKGARNLFIHHALVEMETGRQFCRGAYQKHNREVIDRVKAMQHKLRRRDLLADAAKLFGFFDARIPATIHDGPGFDAWRRGTERNQPKLLFLSMSDVLTGDEASLDLRNYPDDIAVRGIKLDLSYLHDLGHEADGLTVTVPVALLPQLHGAMFDRLVPGYLEEKIEQLIRSLPKALRVKFVPVPEWVQRVRPAVAASKERLTLALAKELKVQEEDFDPAQLPLWMNMRYRIIDAAGVVLGVGRDLNVLRVQLGIKARGLFEDLPDGPWKKDGITRWDFGDLPDEVTVDVGALKMPAYVGLVDKGQSVSLRLFESMESMRSFSRAGIRRLFMIQMASEMKYLERSLPGLDRSALLFKAMGTKDELRADILNSAADNALTNPDPADVRSKEQFVHFATFGWKRLVSEANRIALVAGEVLEAHHAAKMLLSRPIPELLLPSVRDVEDQLSKLVYKGFLTQTPTEWTGHLPRFVKAAIRRLEKLFNAGAQRDMEAMKPVSDAWRQYKTRAREHEAARIQDDALEIYRWMIEEFRVSVFAQELKTSIPISPQRLEKQWELVRPAK